MTFLAFAHAALVIAVIVLALEVNAVDARDAASRESVRCTASEIAAAHSETQQAALDHERVLKAKDAELQYLCEALLAAESREEEIRWDRNRSEYRFGEQSRRVTDARKREEVLKVAIRTYEAELAALRKAAERNAELHLDALPGETDEDRFKRLMRAGVALYRSGRKNDGMQMVEAALWINVDDKVLLFIRDELDMKTYKLMMEEDGGRLRHPWRRK